MKKKIPSMEVGFVGLGRMGKSMVFRLLAHKHKVVVWNRSQEPVKEVAKKGAIPSTSIPNMIAKLSKHPKIVWIMLPAGEVTEQHIKAVVPHLKKGDILIDGGNSNFNDTIKRYKELSKKGIKFMDIGTSGGIIAAKIGYCMMVGGDKKTFEHIMPLLKALCIEEGFAYMGESGAGHYVKMVHNAVEYGMMQAIAEGFDLLSRGRFKNLNLRDISHVWNHGSIVSSFLMKMTEQALEKDSSLSSLKPYVEDSGEGRWASIEAIEQKVPFAVNTYALHSRYSSRDENSMAFRMLAAMRNEFGGHSVKKR